MRQRVSALGINDLPGLDGNRVSRAVLLLSKDRARAGVLTFELDNGPDKGIHQCEALGRGTTALSPKPGWTRGVIKEPDGRRTPIYYAPQEEENGVTIPGIYELQNIRPDDYKLRLLNKDLSGEEELVRRLSSPDEDKKPFFSGVSKTWYPRDPRYAKVVPVDMLWSERYQPQSQGADFPVYERPGVKKDPDQLRANPRYYFGPFGKFGTAIHTDRWDDPQTAADSRLSAKDEFRNFLFRDTQGCVKLHPDCLRLLNAFIDGQRAKKRVVQLDVRELDK
ncbi:MAG: hypothetical protein HY551_08315 [Elusimicrobia bacterium]|nr:hypothetical protein [Elusimicrobiota bacterium]